MVGIPKQNIPQFRIRLLPDYSKDGVRETLLGDGEGKHTEAEIAGNIPVLTIFTPVLYKDASTWIALGASQNGIDDPAMGISQRVDTVMGHFSYPNIKVDVALVQAWLLELTEMKEQERGNENSVIIDDDQENIENVWYKLGAHNLSPGSSLKTFIPYVGEGCVLKVTRNYAPVNEDEGPFIFCTKAPEEVGYCPFLATEFIYRDKNFTVTFARDLSAEDMGNLGLPNVRPIAEPNKVMTRIWCGMLGLKHLNGLGYKHNDMYPRNIIRLKTGIQLMDLEKVTPLYLERERDDLLDLVSAFISVYTQNLEAMKINDRFEVCREYMPESLVNLIASYLNDASSVTLDDFISTMAVVYKTEIAELLDSFDPSYKKYAAPFLAE